LRSRTCHGGNSVVLKLGLPAGFVDDKRRAAHEEGEMLEEATVRCLAEELEAAELGRSQIGQFSQRHPDLDIQEAYRIQRAWMELKRAKGRTTIGRKIGLTSRTMQRAVNITEPDYGLLLDDMLFPDGQDLPFGRFIEPRVEVELAFILKRRLEGNVTMFDVLNATDYVVPAIEIIDARIQRVDPRNGRTRTVVDTISDNAANAGIVLGGRPVRPDAVDLRWIGAIMHRNGVIEDTGLAAAVLNHPANGVAWLATRLAPHGEYLEAGEIILGGSFTSPQHARQGDSFHVDFGALGSISVRFQ
jgi:2-oxo-hept-3-ene-1,7-dioate hydratase